MQSGLVGRVRIPAAAFNRYLRTGVLAMPDEIEVKFNPWHDPKTGRFTFRGDGTWGGGGFTGGGGGSFDGGGASGSWGDLSGEARARTSGAAIARPLAIISSSVAPAEAQQTAKSGWHSVTANGYVYQIDGDDRTRQVTGTLVLNPDQTRSRASQATAGGADRLPTDDGGHYIARRFDGPTDAFNHFAQDANFNRGGYRALEATWAAAVKDGKPVDVTITPDYAGSSQRPNDIRVFYTIGGQPFRTGFSNASGGKRHGAR